MVDNHDLISSIINWAGCFLLCYIFLSNLEKLEKNYVVTLSVIICLMLIYMGRIVQNFGKGFQQFLYKIEQILNKLVNKYAKKDTFLTAKRHSVVCCPIPTST